MSKRRKIGERVWVRSGAGFGAAGPVGCWATIKTGTWRDRDKTGPWNPTDANGHSEELCWCGKPGCREWPNLDGDDGEGLCHVGECQMLDEPPDVADRLRAALAWYAEPSHWRETGDGWLRNTSPAASDGGALARATLENLKNEKEQRT